MNNLANVASLIRLICILKGVIVGLMSMAHVLLDQV